jgi:hypothetical protein
MLKQVTAFLFFVAFIGQSFNKPFIVMDYYANNAAYLKACVNKAKPKMNCKGKCQMMKKLQEEEKKEQQLPDRNPDTKTEIFCKDNFSFHIETPSVLISSIDFSFEKNAALSSMTYSIFHPPQV